MKSNVAITILGTTMFLSACAGTTEMEAPRAAGLQTDLSACGTPSDTLVVTLPDPAPSSPDRPPAATVHPNCMYFEKGKSRKLKLQLRADALLVFTDHYPLANEEYVISGPQTPGQPLDIIPDEGKGERIELKYTVVDLRFPTRRPLDPIIVIDR